MNYQRIHDQIIDHAKTRTLGKEIYTEKHHIIPKSMNGLDVKENLVRLTAREHYLIHWLLYKIHRTDKLADAWHIMLMSSCNHSRYTSHSFKYAREAAALSSSNRMKGRDNKGKNNPMYGRVHSEETRKHMSERMKGPKHHGYGKPGPNAGKSLSEETKKKMRIAATRRIKCLYCDLVSRPASISRFHNENCKYK